MVGHEKRKYNTRRIKMKDFHSVADFFTELKKTKLTSKNKPREIPAENHPWRVYRRTDCTI